MVGRGGGRKIGTKIAPGRLQSCVQATRNMLLNKQNASGINKNTNPFITDETIRLVSKNLERQRRTHTCNNIIPNESPPVNDHIPHYVPDSENEVQNTHAENEPNNSYEDDQESQGLIRPMNEGLLGKKRRKSNFVSRIELALQCNEALEPRPRENVVRNDAEQINDVEIDGNTATSRTKGKGKRGKYKSCVVDMKIKGIGSKLKVTIPDYVDRAIGENARHLVNECGRVVRTKAPFDVKNWAEAFKVAGDTMLKEIQERFEIAQCADYLRMYAFVVETMQRLYRQFKSRLHYYYKECGETVDERKKNPPPDIPKSLWDHLCEHYESDKFKAASERNSKNRRSGKRVKATTGNLSFPETEDILTKMNGNVKPTADKIWIAQHSHRNKEGQLEWLNGDPISKEIHGKLKNMVALVGDSKTQEEILMEVLGPKSGYVRGKGTGVRSYAKQKAQLEQQRIVNEQQEKIQQQEEQIKELQKTVEAIRTQQEATKESLKQSILQELLNLGGR